MRTNKKSAPAGTGTVLKTTFDSHDHTGSNPLIGWTNLANLSRTHQPPRSRKRGKQCGRIDANLAAQLVLLAVVILLFVSRVTA